MLTNANVTFKRLMALVQFVHNGGRRGGGEAVILSFPILLAKKTKKKPTILKGKNATCQSFLPNADL